jgi:hypothetical protein
MLARAADGRAGVAAFFREGKITISSNEHYNVESNGLCSDYHDKVPCRDLAPEPGSRNLSGFARRRDAARNDGLTDEHSFQLSTWREKRAP